LLLLLSLYWLLFLLLLPMELLHLCLLGQGCL
jgi:hypothetical protein